MIRVEAVQTKKQKKTFIHLPFKIYKDDPHWVAPLLMDVKMKLNKQKFPFYEFGDMELFLAYRGDEVVGRIAAIYNSRYNEYHKDKSGFFGFFECTNDQEASDALFDAAKAWLKAKGLETMTGPVNPSTNYETGLLTEGFDDSPRIMMTYNPKYYQTLMNNYGLEKAIGLLAYKISSDTVFTEKKLERVAKLAKKRYNVKLRPISKKNFKADVQTIKMIYDKAWEDNTGFVPITDSETDALAKELKLVVEPKLAQFVETEDGETIGIFVALPDYFAIIKKMKGRLFPFNFLRMFTDKKAMQYIRVWALGLVPEYRNKGIVAEFHAVFDDFPVHDGI
ncbi:MAG: hypothetical protein AAFV80_12540, partial [Bacteroidota bacterium]